MKKIKISVKIIVGFLLVALISGIVGAVSVVYTRKITKADQELYSFNTVPLTYVGSVGMNFQEIRVLFRDAIAEMDEAKRKDMMARIQRLREENDASVKKIEVAFTAGERKKLFGELKIALAAYGKSMNKMTDYLNTGGAEFASGILQTEGLLAARQLTGAIAKLFDSGVSEAKKTADSNDSMAKASSYLSISLTLLNVIAAALLGIFLSIAITRPINRIVTGLREGAEQVASASNEVSASSQHLAEGASQQASSLEETAASLEEMSSMTRQNADNANQAKKMMDEARGVVEKANNQMARLTEAIGQITKSSEETGKIIKTIDEIAFQTNLLALNAAVEAARAGEAGAGFAVVADEVRSLALRSAEAAKTTSDLIEKTIKAVKNGNEITIATQAAFSANADISRKINQLVEEIAAASQEQDNGIGQVNTAVSEMDKVTQRTAANAEESAATAEEMNAQAQQLKKYVDELAEVIGGSSSASPTLLEYRPALSEHEEPQEEL
ncbi:MAG: methyl-accepting chemotaxis protein [Syntrophales bacterium]